MNAADLLMRVLRKPPGHLFRRAFMEAGRLARRNLLQRRLKSLTAGDVARTLGTCSVVDYWSKLRAGRFLYAEEERHRLRDLYRSTYAPESAGLRKAVDKVLVHEFDLLGSGPTLLGPEIDWHTDFKSGRKWDLHPSRNIDYAELDRPSDVKVPWELSRCHHLVTLGQAWLLFGDERAVSEFERQVRSWIGSNPPGYGVNWASTMEVALRAVNWIWALALFADAPFAPEFIELIIPTLFSHGLWIPEHLEFASVNGNHYIADVLGMVACGALFRGCKEGERWFNQGSRILEEEIRLQVESDGVDIEASVPYHRLALEIFLAGSRFMQAGRGSASTGYCDRLERMLGFVCAYTRPDGSCPIVGDADDGRVLAFGRNAINDHRYLLSIGFALFHRDNWGARAEKCWEDTVWFLGPDSYFEPSDSVTETAEESASFSASGFHVLRSPGQHLFIDAGPVGFRGLGGHGHNDCLSFEWHAAGRSLLTDSGLYVYTASPEWRNLFRSTAFHNTIRVDGEEINRFLSPPTLWFLGNDAQPVDVQFRSDPEEDLLSAGHTGYLRLPDPVLVRRSLRMNRRKAEIHLVDRLEGNAPHLVEIFFHAAIGADYHSAGEDAVEFVWPSGHRLRIERSSGPGLRMERRDGWFAPSYGVKLPRPVCVASLYAKLPVEIEWRLTVSTWDESARITGE
jgi:hypothetical protein